MSWRIRAIVALLIALAYANAPLVLDACAASCASVEPSCHHSFSTSAHAGHVPFACGHDQEALRAKAAGVQSAPALTAPADRVTVQWEFTLPPLQSENDDGVEGPPLVSAQADSAVPLRV